VDKHFVVENVVATANLGQLVNLDEISQKLPWWTAEYKPEQFLGAIHRMQDPKVVFLIFSERGSFVCTGTKKTEDVKKAVDILGMKIEELKLFREE